MSYRWRGTRTHTQAHNQKHNLPGTVSCLMELFSPLMSAVVRPNFAAVITLKLSFPSLFLLFCIFPPVPPPLLFFFHLFLYHLFVHIFILIIAVFSSFLSYNLLIFFCGFFDCIIKTVNSAIYCIYFIFLLTVWPQYCHLRSKRKLQFTTGRISSEFLSLTRSHLKIYFKVLIGKLYTASYPGFFFVFCLVSFLSLNRH